MSLFGSIRLGANALHADQIALQVVGQNIANANTPDYIREEAVFAPAMSQKIGNLTLGLGVRVEAVIQKIDKYLEERLRGAVSDKSSAEAQRDVYAQLEQLLGTLEETGIAPSMTRFFNSVSQVLNQPEDVSVRNQAVLDAQRLTSEINTLARNVRRLRLDVNERIAGMADQINGLVEQIRDLNLQIMSCEAGIFAKSEAVGLRDQRQAALGKLADLVNIRVKEDDTGSLTVYVGSQFLVNDAIVNRVMTSYTGDRGMSVASVRFVGTDSPLEATSGQLHGLLAARDDGLGGFLDALNDFAGTLAFEFNKIFSSGQGLRGYDAATSQSRATAADQPLDQAGLSFTPVNGSFRVLVYDTETKTTRSAVIPVRLLGDSNDTTLQGLADALNAVSPLSATVTSDKRLSIRRLTSSQQFAFADDTSGVLAGLGINTLFTGSTAEDLGVNSAIVADPARFAASSGGIGVDTLNAVKLAQFPDRPIATHNNDSITTIYDLIAGRVAQGSAVAKANSEATGTIEQTLRGRQMAISGVSIDEEAVNLITLQKAFQASARFIATVRDMLDTLMSI